MNYFNYQLKGKRFYFSPRQFLFAFIYMQIFYIFDVCKRMMGTQTTALHTTAQSRKAIKLIIVLTQSTDETKYN